MTYPGNYSTRAMIVNGEADLQEQSREGKSWKYTCMRRSLSKESFILYLGVAICGDGNLESAIRGRIKAAANASRKVEGVIRYRQISRTLKGKTLCVIRAYRYDLYTIVLTEKQQKVEV